MSWVPSHPVQTVITKNSKNHHWFVTTEHPVGEGFILQANLITHINLEGRWYFIIIWYNRRNIFITEPSFPMAWWLFASIHSKHIGPFC